MYDEQRRSIVEALMTMHPDAKPHDEKKLPPVTVHYRGREIGMYGARFIGRYSMLLRHGGISFPVGTTLGIQFRELVHDKTTLKKFLATVRDNSDSGIFLGLLTELS